KELRAYRVLRSRFFRTQFPFSSGGKPSRLYLIAEVRGNEAALQVSEHARVQDRERDFEPREKVSRHPIRAGKIKPLRAFEIVYTAVLQKAVNDADHAN